MLRQHGPHRPRGLLSFGAPVFPGADLCSPTHGPHRQCDLQCQNLSPHSTQEKTLYLFLSSFFPNQLCVLMVQLVKETSENKKTKNFLPKLRIWVLYTSGYGDHRYIFLNCAFYSFSNEDMCTMKTFKNNHSFFPCKPKQDCSGVLCVLDTSFETAAGGHTSRGLGWGDLTGADS